LRRAVALKWLVESPYTNYRYDVERCINGNRVYLLRPTWLNKGFDFQVNVAGFRSVIPTARGQTKEMPSHNGVIHDLQSKLKGSLSLADSLFYIICGVYEGEEPQPILERNRAVTSIVTGLPLDELLSII
jgi:hypothetical protein